MLGPRKNFARDVLLQVAAGVRSVGCCEGGGDSSEEDVVGKLSQALAALAHALQAKANSNEVTPFLADAERRPAKVLAASDCLFVVAFDDLERLKVRQLADVLRLISSVASFPNTAHILCMDRYRIAKEHGGRERGGHGFLEKFTSVTFDVPATDPVMLGEMLLQRVRSSLEANDVELSWQRFQEHWHSGLSELIDTPRDVIRLANAYDMALEVVGVDTDAADLLAIEALRILVPDAHAEMQRRSISLLGEGPFILRTLGMSDDERKELFSSEYERIRIAAPEGQRDATDELLKSVFSCVRGLQRSGHCGSSTEAHRERRAQSHEHFANYFQWTRAAGALSEQEMWAALGELTMARTDDELVAWNTAHSATLRKLLEKFRNYMDATPSPQARVALAAALLRAGHQCSARPDPLTRSFGEAHTLVLNLCEYLLLALNERHDWCSEVVDQCADTSWLYGVTAFLGRQLAGRGSLRLELASPPVARLADRLHQLFSEDAYTEHDDGCDPRAGHETPPACERCGRTG